MADVVLKLGDFTFQGNEIPESISFGGEQALAVHRMVGGVKQVDAMGDFIAPIGWTGWLEGKDAMSRARQLRDMRAAGVALVLSWSELQYAVLIKEFDPDFRRFYKIPYRIVCEVIEDLTLSTAGSGDLSIDDLINGDVGSMNDLAGQIGDISLSGLMSTVNSAVQSVSSFANAAQSTLNSVLQPLAAVRTQVGTLIAQANNTLVNVTTLGGILPNNPIAQQVQKMSSQIVAAQQLPVLVAMDRTVGRVQMNIGSIYSSAKQITTAGGNLMDLAVKEYGDAMAWTGLAKANPQLNGDPQVTGIQTITVPPSKDTDGGLLNS
ncbi:MULTISPECIES: collagen-like triple helix repeat-containing protein [unclassified Cupriavidus]|uniref:collagen-like triple helix repeat-containing protein n=1 Tax=unclassified Cupriavidus TaxID=2640874 RepID=UPI001C007D48|nr:MULTISPECIES: collagen-like triple helix repeat-containing protein [unclassified Cupriavidus]MCA3184415.1 hypothetical protein [Cupriavidus sp.]MCA3194313.1 hypothetical protein [Cupriavidus sp.]MCA3200421.1 hypothetical protein [Cupriavidus sp.]MCA3233589.1 hypothetical protein [Cupriavidus sp.]QWE95342.1 collagen-like triple helix repeat-containing protein [Cupriavidus sp. EM10]